MYRAVYKYYYDVTRFNLAFSILIGALRGVLSGVIMLGTLGMVIGLLCYQYFQKDQYYFYYNLGLSKPKLITITWVINAAACLLILIVLQDV